MFSTTPFLPHRYIIQEPIIHPHKYSTLEDYMATIIVDYVKPPTLEPEVLTDTDPDLVECACTMLAWHSYAQTPPLGELVWNRPITKRTISELLQNPTETQRLIQAYQTLITNLYLGILSYYPNSDVESIVAETALKQEIPEITEDPNEPDQRIWKNRYSPLVKPALITMLTKIKETGLHPQDIAEDNMWIIPKYPHELNIIITSAAESV